MDAKFIEGTERAFCPACGFVRFLDPKVASGTIFDLDGRVVLLKRGIEPSLGKWVFPGGYVDRGEPVDVAAVRETREEVGLDVQIEDLVGIFSYEGVPVVLVAYSARVIGGKLKGNEETLDVRSFSEHEIPWKELAFQSTGDALRLWFERIGRRLRKKGQTKRYVRHDRRSGDAIRPQRLHCGSHACDDDLPGVGVEKAGISRRRARGR